MATDISSLVVVYIHVHDLQVGPMGVNGLWVYVMLCQCVCVCQWCSMCAVNASRHTLMQPYICKYMWVRCYTCVQAGMHATLYVSDAVCQCWCMCLVSYVQVVLKKFVCVSV